MAPSRQGGFHQGAYLSFTIQEDSVMTVKHKAHQDIKI